MTTPPEPRRLRELAATLRAAVSPHNAGDLAAVRAAVLNTARILTLHAGTGDSYDPPDPDPGPVADVRNLPAGSVVAVGRDVYICRVHGAGTPGYSRCWISAGSFAVPYADGTLNAIIRDSGTLPELLRHGYGPRPAGDV